MMLNRDRSIGIDLGTSYCRVAIWKDNAAELIPNDNGDRQTPTFVAFTDKGRLIGTAAKNQCSRNAQNTIFDITKIIGKKL